MNQYFYLDADRQQCGPVSGAQLPQCGVTPQTLIWCNGMPDWAPAGSVPEVAPLFSATPPPPEINIYDQQIYGSGQGQQPYDESGYSQSYSQSYAGGYNGGVQPPRPDNYLVWAILATICCCLPFGIVAIVYAAKVNSLYASGRYAEAEAASRNAKNWCIWSLVSYFIIVIFYALLYAIGAVAAC